MKAVKVNLNFVFILFVIIGIISFATVRYIASEIMPRGAEVLHSYAETNMFEILNSTVDEVIEKYSIDYATYVLMAAPFMACNFVMNQCLRSEGSATLSMIGMGFGGMAGGLRNATGTFK